MHDQVATNLLPTGQKSEKMTVGDAITGRHSIRRFKSTPVPISTVESILLQASRAPSGTNTQPWKVHCVTGERREQLTRAVLAAALNGEKSEEYPYMPAAISEPYLTRRRRVGYELYRLYGIKRDDYPRRKAAMLRNFEFFGAPVGLFFSMDRSLLYGSWLDCGMFMQNVMLAARGFGLETCPQQAWCEFGHVVHDQLDIPADQILISGMSLGFADPDAPENTLVSEREPLANFVTFLSD